MTYRLICADVLDGLRSLPDEFVQCVVTSPPYWRQRDYGIKGQIGLENIDQKHRDFVERAWNVWRKGYAVLTDINGALYVYAQQ